MIYKNECNWWCVGDRKIRTLNISMFYFNLYGIWGHRNYMLYHARYWTGIIQEWYKCLNSVLSPQTLHTSVFVCWTERTHSNFQIQNLLWQLGWRQRQEQGDQGGAHTNDPKEHEGDLYKVGTGVAWVLINRDKEVIYWLKTIWERWIFGGNVKGVWDASGDIQVVETNLAKLARERSWLRKKGPKRKYSG